MIFYQMQQGRDISAWIRFSIAACVYGVALGLRFLVLPVDAGLAYLFFYPGTAVVALLCGVVPSLVYILLAALVGGYIFLPPYWGLAGGKWVATGAFVLSASTILLVINFYQRRVTVQTRELLDEVATRQRLGGQLQQSLDRATRFESEFRQTFELAAVGIAHVAPDGRWLRVNQKLCDIIGYAHGDVLTRTFQDITHPDDLDSDLTHVQQVLAGDIETYSMEKRYLRQSGAIVWVNLTVSLVRHDDGSPNYFIKVIEDIQRRKEAEAALSESEERLRLFIEHAPASLAMFDAGMRYIAVSRRWKDDYALGAREIIGHSHYEMFPEMPERWKEIHRRGLAGEVVRADADCFVREDGGRLWLRWEVRPWHGSDGQVGGIVIFSEDISYYKESEEAIRRLNADLELRVAERTAELEHSNQELNDFAYIASHDLKEPLRGLHNYASFLKEDHAASLDDEGKHFLDRMQRLVERMTDLIDRLLAYSRLGSSELPMEPVALAEILDEVAEDLRPFLKEKSVELVRAASLPTVVCNATRIREVLQNLICNAAKYNDKPEKRVEVGSSSGAQPIMYVRDNGIGIAPQHQDSVFRIFKRLHEQDKYGGGTGAGLTIVKKIVERHGGRIWLESTPGVGTTFYFTLSGEP